jgi:hypothetical protein
MEEKTDSFTLFLPSNSSTSWYPDNRTSSFKTRLVDPVVLDTSSAWEVALTEIQYPVSWINVRSGHNAVEFYVVKGDGDPSYFMSEYLITPGAYLNVQQLNAEMQLARAAWQDLYPASRFTITMDEESRKTVVAAAGMKMVFKGMDVADVLGFEHDTDTGWEDRVVSPNMALFLQDFSAMYCYSDIVDYQYVGDTRAQLLRIVPVSGRSGQVVYHHFDSPIYVKVIRSTFQSIEIEIRQDTGALVQFSYGKVVLVLHFRKAI